MKPRVELNPILLKQYRVRRGLSNKEISDCLRKSDKQNVTSLSSMYERIERTGITGPETAEKIAKKLDVSVDLLTGNPRANDHSSYFWLETGRHGEVHQGMMLWNIPFIHELQRQVRDLLLSQASKSSVEVFISNQPHCCNLNFKYSDGFETTQLALRACKPSNNGVSWLEFTDWEKVDLAETLKNLTYQFADVVHIDGNQIPPDLSALTYELREVKIKQNCKEIESAQSEYFTTEADLINAIVNVFEGNSQLKIYVKVEDFGLSFIQIKDDSRSLYSVFLNWKPAEQDFQLAPWRLSKRRSTFELLQQALKTAYPAVQFYKWSSATKNFVPGDSASEDSEYLRN